MNTKAKKMTDAEKDRLADLIREEAKKTRFFQSSAFYWLKAENPDMKLSDAVDIVNILVEDNNPFAY